MYCPCGTLLTISSQIYINDMPDIKKWWNIQRNNPQLLLLNIYKYYTKVLTQTS